MNKKELLDIKKDELIMELLEIMPLTRIGKLTKMIDEIADIKRQIDADNKTTSEKT
jgi:hypothetical protein